ncbi:MAG: DUF1622 domain-containing protein [Chloroflexota bacterium]|nr:DUF1622 domain-containing protein [Chloroflexota bacterium]
MTFSELIERAGQVIEGAGVAVIVLGAVIATIRFLSGGRQRSGSDAYQAYRHSVGRAILLGLEFLVAGDIIRTVAVDPTFRSVGVLAGIVLIRTFLSLTLELEIEGRWPWQRASETAGAGRVASGESRA